MSFYSKETTCRFEIKDHEEKDNFVFMGLSVSVGSDITISVSGNTQTAVIPLNKYFSSINRKFVKGMGCYSLSEDLQGNHSFTLEDVEFFK